MNAPFQCAEHPDARMTTGCCIQCRKPVCVTCMELRGYFCCDACKTAFLSSKASAQPAQAASEQPSEAQLQRWTRHGDLMASWLFKRIPLCLLAGAAGVAALAYLDTSGDEAWSARLPRAGSPAEVVAAGDAVLVRCRGGQCLSLSSGTGAERWRSQPNPESSSEPDWAFLLASPDGPGLEATNGLILCHTPSSVSVLLAETGRTLWDRSRSGFSPKPAVLREGRVLMADAREPVQSAGSAGASLICMDARSGEELWRRTYDGREIQAADARGDLCFCVTRLPPGDETSQPCPSHTVSNASAEASCELGAREVPAASGYELSVSRLADGAPLWTAQLRTGALGQTRLFDDRIAVVAGTHLYVLSTGGVKLAHTRLPANTRSIRLAGDVAAVATADGRIVVFSARDGRAAWSGEAGGPVWSLELAGDSLYAVAGVRREASDKLPDGTPIAPAPRSAHQQLLEELQASFEREGPGEDGEAAPARPACRTLINFRLADGQERWRRQPLVEEPHVLPDGNCLLLNTAFGGGALLRTGDGACLTEHLQKSGKEVWRHALPDTVLSIAADARSVFLLTGSGCAVAAKGGRPAEADGALHALRRRTLLNKVRKP